MSNNKSYIFCCIISLIEDIAIMAMAVFLSVHTNNYNWMWLLILCFYTNYQSGLKVKKE